MSRVFLLKEVIFLYERFLSILNKKGLSHYKVSKATGISQATLSSWKNGTYVPKIDKLKRIAEFLEIDVGELTGNTKSHLDAVPIIGQIACGSPIFAEENIEGYAAPCYGVSSDFCLFAKGDSMVGARIYDGDLVYIRKQSMVDNGEIAAVLIDDSATLKRVYYYPEQSKIILTPENPKYAPLVYEGDELNEIQILGKAVSFTGRI